MNRRSIWDKYTTVEGVLSRYCSLHLCEKIFLQQYGKERLLPRPLDFIVAPVVGQQTCKCNCECRRVHIELNRDCGSFVEGLFIYDSFVLH
jgi:hypothetical protein